MPTKDCDTNLQHIQLIAKYQKHYKLLGCSHDKTFFLARKMALKEMRTINGIK